MFLMNKTSRTHTTFTPGWADSAQYTAIKLNQLTKLASVVDVIMEAVASALHVPAVGVLLYDDQAQSVRLEHAYGFFEAGEADKRQVPWEAYQQEILSKGRLAVFADVNYLPDYAARLLWSGENLRSLVFAHLFVNHKYLGSLFAGSRATPRSFTEQELTLLQVFSQQLAVAIANTRVLEETERRLQRIQALYTIETAINGSLNLETSLEMLLSQAIPLLDLDAANILMLNHTNLELEYFTGSGLERKMHWQTSFKLGIDLPGIAALERKTVGGEVSSILTMDSARNPVLVREGISFYYAAPIMTKGDVKGVLEVYRRADAVPDNEWTTLLETLAKKIGMLIEGAELFTDRQRLSTELELAHDAFAETWVNELDRLLHEPPGHTHQVADLTIKIARLSGISKYDLVHVRRGAILHDIGKLRIPAAILTKPGPLTDVEWAAVRKHPEYAYDMLSRLKHLRPALEIPYSHHEKWDGSGYPMGYSGERIPLAARIFAVVDTWDVMRTVRPYRPAYPDQAVLSHIQQQSGLAFDPQVVEVFLRVIG
jgi:HD-GYP domain-containing protein (c-di-GMP phosphodiesterase class II)